MDEKIKMLLIQKLGYSENQVELLSKDPDSLSKVLGFLQLIKRSAGDNKAKGFALSRLKEIQQTLDDSKVEICDAIRKARAEYYTFQKI